MANKLYEEDNISAIADAIRTKNGSEDTYTVSEMAGAIEDLPSGGSSELQTFMEGKTNYQYAFAYNSTATTFPQLNTSNGTNFDHMFQSCTRLTTIPQLDFSAGRNFGFTFGNCSGLTTIPQLNTSSGASFSNMFVGCSNLTTVPILNMARATTNSAHQNMFQNCPSLSNESLNNIMASLITKTSGANKTLKYVGLTSAQATTCTTLSNYADFVAAGWTTGY